MRVWDRGDKGRRSGHLRTRGGGQDWSRDEKTLKKSAGSKASSPLGSYQSLRVYVPVRVCMWLCVWVYACGMIICVCMCVELCNMCVHVTVCMYV